ncbi:hypothetical protein BDZ97DRAFT_1652817 [Flammula alnicola]|nr:hypothetical protein BDZ97DRAFT_1652817 [Flammula alnicola]
MEATLPGGALAAGFTIFDRLYVWNRTIYAVTSNPKSFPLLKYILAHPQNVGRNRNLDPTPLDMQILTPEAAKPILRERAVVMDGMSFIFHDTNQVMPHYYHWWGELILGAMRMYSGLSFVPGISSPLPEPKHFLLPNIIEHQWRDPAGVNGPLKRAGWPDTPIERNDLWKDLIALNQTFVFERAMIVSRPAAHKSPLASLWFKMISSSISDGHGMNVTVPEHFWEPLRKRVVHNTIGYLPVMNNAGVVMSSPKSTLPIVTYISRQNGVRRFSQKAHEGLVKALKELADEGLCEVNVVAMEKMTFSQQLETVAGTTIMVGIHGNGLTHQIWMPPSPRSTVIEVFFPKAYLHDYEILARNMGHMHYAVWNDTTLTYPAGQWFKGVEHGDRRDFNGFSIPVHGPTVAQVIRERLTSPIP